MIIMKMNIKKNYYKLIELIHLFISIKPLKIKPLCHFKFS
jgi:hypothetical protein